MDIVLGNIVANVTSATDGELDWIRELLRWKDQSARHRTGYRGDGYIYLFSVLTNEFPAGFIRMVAETAANDGIPLRIADRRRRPAEPDWSADLTWLRDYQLEAVQAGVKRTRCVLWCPTGSGKTEIAIGLSKVLDCNWLFVVHRSNLMVQAAKRYEKRTGLEAGVVGEGQWEERKFTVATFQTLYSRMKKKDPEALAFMDSVEAALIDEVHTLPANSYYQVSQALSNAYYRIGVSGTPMQRDDEKSMMIIGATGPVAYRIPATKLIEAGILSRPHIRMLRCDQRIKLPPKPQNHRAVSRWRAKIWAKVNKELIVTSAYRNSLIVDMVNQAEPPCLVFVTQLAHGRELEDAIRRKGLQVEFVNGNKATPERMASITRLERGDIDALICTVIFNEGVDIPELRSVVIASAGQSAIAALQRVGRGMRVTKDKKDFEVWDVWDEGSLLENHSKGRKRAYGVEGYEVEVIDP